MSLLLNALKKAEEGEQPTAATEESSAAVASPALAATAEVAKTAAPSLAVAAAQASPEEKKTIDFDSIEINETEEQIASAPAPEVERKKKVGAARVFGASEDSVSSGSSGISKAIYGVFGVMVVGAGGYFVLAAGLIPGVDLESLSSLMGAEEIAPVARTRGTDVGAQLKVADDLVLLPIPSVDVQSEVDFAALRLPENDKDNIGEDSYVKQIAFLTGFDINKEKTRKLDEQRQLLLELEINEDFVEDAEDDLLVEGQSDSKPEELLLQTASSSREAKLRFDSRTPSDNELDIAIKNIQSLDEKDDEVQAVTKIAQVQVKLSAEGQERQKMLNQARAFYNKGSYLEAETIYRNVLIMSPTNRDALRGIARIGVTTGRYQAAVATYLDLLNYYPNDPIAIAELSNLRGDSGNFYEVEKALKGTLGKMPAADGRLYFSLGNLYAQNRKFKDAQQAYFDAFSRETNNPDYAYNLAVILDYLNKPQLALRYYREALQLSVDLPVGFNRVEVKARIEDLN
ncbi:MAG: hypothetical protein K0U15_01585 [Proteobacteria bacterium]|nr:hypothetical protein [Pseudomonadota bacterium]